MCFMDPDHADCIEKLDSVEEFCRRTAERFFKATDKGTLECGKEWLGIANDIKSITDRVVNMA